MMKKIFHTIACSFAAGIVLAACAPPGTMHQAEARLAQRASSSPPSRPIYLRAMKTQLATPRAAIGPLYTGSHCVPKGEVIWDATLFRQVSHQLPKIFRSEAQHAHYKVPPDGSGGASMPADASARPDYAEVDMQVHDAGAGLCIQDEGTSGSVRLKIFWQVYAAGTSTPLYESVTQGSYDASITEKRSAADFFSIAFSDALRNLLAERGFREALLMQGAPSRVPE